MRVLYDALGSVGLSGAFWQPLRDAGGEVRVFNPLSVNRLGIRDHRKLLVCDERIAFIGGFNIATEYDGDGVSCGWCDIGLKIEGPLAGQLVDYSASMLPGQLRTSWQNILNTNTTLPRPALSGIRLYERYFYLSPPTLLTP